MDVFANGCLHATLMPTRVPVPSFLRFFGCECVCGHNEGPASSL